MRLIDADAFKDYIREACEDLAPLFNDNGKVARLVTESFCKDIDEQPTIQPEPHWIPVTERLPKTGESVMICDAYGDICIGHRTMGGYYFPDFCDDKIKDVRAWCELPEPYKGVTE